MSDFHAPGGSFSMPMYNKWVPKAVQPWIYLCFAFLFQLSGGMYGGTLAHIMGDNCMIREDVLMIVLCGVVGVNMPFPFLFKFKFRFANKRLLINAALIIAMCNILCTCTENIFVLCVLSYVAGFFKLCGTFECFSNIQLWMTPKRDFAIFFPLLYCVVLGNMSLSPWISLHLAYIFQSWWAMNMVMAIAMLCIAGIVFFLTHDFHIMKPIPLISVDWLGCVLWSAVMIEIIYIFNYGEYYNWWNGEPIRVVAVMLLVTFYFAIRRMRHIRHPYLEPQAWLYKGLIPLFGLFILVELVSSTPKVLQSRFTGMILGFGIMDTSRLYIVEWIGTLCGCLSVMVWVKLLRLKYTRLLQVGMAALLAYEVMMYFSVTPSLDLASLYIPVWCRTFGVAIFFTALTIYLQEMMDFKHFFMGLTMIGLVRNGVVETVCSGMYSLMLRHNITENIVRGVPHDMAQSVMVSVKQLYGATCLIATAVLLVFLVWNIQPVRSTLRRMPYWNVVGRFLRRSPQ